MNFNANQAKVRSCIKKFTNSVYKGIPFIFVLTAMFVIVNYLKIHDKSFTVFFAIVTLLGDIYFIYNIYKVSKMINKIIILIDINDDKIICSTTGISLLVFIKNEPLTLQFNQKDVLFKESTSKYPFPDEFNTGICLLISDGDEYLLLPSVYDNFQELKSTLDRNLNL